MNVKRLAVALLCCFAIFFLAASQASAQCSVKFLNQRIVPDLNAEGIYERAADIVISGPLCFTNQEILTVSYNAIMTLPTKIGPGNKGTYWDITDASETLTLDAVNPVTVTQGIDPSGTVTVIEISIDKGSTDPTASIILENLRFDVTGSTCKALVPSCQMVPDGQYLDAYVGAAEWPTQGPFHIGYVKKTIAAAAVQVGWGFEDGVCPFPGYCGYPNKGATTASLIQQGIWAFLTNPAWSTDFPFRRSTADGDPSPNAADPNQIGPTDLVVDVENIMSGVTVTVPNALVACTGGGDAPLSALATWTWIGGDKSKTGGNLVAIYRTTQSTRTNPTELVVFTTNGPADPGCDAYSTYPLISVVVGNPSGNSADGTMEAYLRVVMGPSLVSAFPGDDVQPGAVPAYLTSVSATGHPTRAILGDTDPEYQPYFFLNPTETVILFPYVTNIDGWQTGIEIGDTGLDTPVFGNSGQNGKLDFYFFPNNPAGGAGTPFNFTLAKGDGVAGADLDASSNLEAGSTFAGVLSTILSNHGHGGNFVGYIIVVAHFNYGHGAGMIFNTAGDITAIPSLILGGRCSYNPNVSTTPPVLGTGSPVTFGIYEPPACSSARQGDLTKLPERLVM